MSLSDSFAAYLLVSFSKIPITRELEYQDYPEFNEQMDKDNQLGFLRSYSRALFDQDPVAYEQELQNYLDNKETADTDV